MATASNTITTSTSSRHKKSRSSNRSADKHSSSRKRRKSSPKDEGSKPNKYKTLSQLAKLVHSGKLKIPCSLVEYVDDHASLIDQLFTILTTEDIEGMLPDILKGMKIKKIKHLCDTQLSKMSPDELHKALTEDPTTANSAIEGQTTNGSAPVISDISDAEMEATSGTNGASSLNVGVVNEEDEIEVNVTCSDLFNSQTEEEEEEGEIKDDEEHSTGSFQRTDTNTNTVNNSVLIDTTSTVGRIGLALSVEDEKRWSRDVPEEARLMEMRLRERLLEMQVKRLTSNREPPAKEKQVQEQQDCISSYSDGSDSVSEVESSNEEPGELAELDLRQRALESLLARRREKLKM